jgi:hypothetical protein
LESLDTIRECRPFDECSSPLGEPNSPLWVWLMLNRLVDPESDDVFMLKNFTKVEEKGDNEDEVKQVDPIQWYGLLASQSLKAAQDRFVKGMGCQKLSLSDVVVLEESIEVANFMAKLRSSEQYVEQIRRKRHNSPLGQ